LSYVYRSTTVRETKGEQTMTETFRVDDGTCYECGHGREAHEDDYRRAGCCESLMANYPARCYCQGYVLREITDLECVCGHMGHDHAWDGMGEVGCVFELRPEEFCECAVWRWKRPLTEDEIRRAEDAHYDEQAERGYASLVAAGPHPVDDDLPF